MYNLFVFLVLLTLSAWVAVRLKNRYPATRMVIFNRIMFMHLVMLVAYYGYATFNRSDSHHYYDKVVNFFRGPSWMDFYGVSTTFVEFIGFPFVHFFGFSYEAMMMLFSWFGLLGFFFFYVFISERIYHFPKVFGFDFVSLIMILPNLHFWSSSFGKGSIIFLGFGLYFFSLNKIQSRWPAALLGAIIIYHVRPHILFVVLAATALGFFFSSRGVSFLARMFVVMLTIGALLYIREDVLALTGIDDENVFQDVSTLDHRAYELSKTGSGVDLTSYSFPMKMFTFIFRPLFIDAPGILGLLVSVENLFYLIMVIRILKSGFVGFFRRSDYTVKAALLSFLGIAAALAQVCGNLGIAMRQKSQVMILLMFVILKYMDDQLAMYASSDVQIEGGESRGDNSLRQFPKRGSGLRQRKLSEEIIPIQNESFGR